MPEKGKGRKTVRIQNRRKQLLFYLFACLSTYFQATGARITLVAAPQKQVCFTVSTTGEILKRQLGLFTFLAVATASHATVYHVEVLPQYQNDVQFDASTINDSGVVAGYSRTGTTLAHKKRLLTYHSATGFEVIADNLSNDEVSRSPFINNAGQIAWSAQPTNAPGQRTYLYTPGLGHTMLDAPVALRHYFPISLNDRGDVLGFSYWGSFPEGNIIWRAGQSAESPPPGIYVSRFSNDGSILGYFGNSGIVWHPGQEFQRFDFPQDVSSFTIINKNASGEITSSQWNRTSFGFEGEGRVWSADLRSFVYHPIMNGRIIDDGSIYGRPFDGTTSPSAAHLGRWTRTGGYEEITEQLDAESAALGFTNWQMRSVNNRGEILARAGFGSPLSGATQPYTVILRPVPEPATLLVLAAGIPALLRRRKR